MTNRIDVLDGYQADIEFENIVEWARLGAIHVRKVDGCDVQHRTFLLAHGESPERLNELSRWHESTAFTQRERVALGLSESISLYPSGNLSEHVLREARRHFSARQVVDLTLAILCVNDWIDLGPSSPLRVLVV
jgi:alkylhydroperoxidase family enzyme